jgi:hypothetical protein
MVYYTLYRNCVWKFAVDCPLHRNRALDLVLGILLLSSLRFLPPLQIWYLFLSSQFDRGDLSRPRKRV